MLMFISISESARRALCHTLVWLNILSVLVAMFMIAYGLDLTFILSEYTSLFESYGGGSLEWFLIGCGVLAMWVNLVGAYLCHLFLRPALREGFRNAIAYYQLSSFFMLGCLFICIGLISANHWKVDDLFKGELTASMEVYDTDSKTKQSFDDMQAKFGCCGNLKYTDWFLASWISERFIDKSTSEQQGGQLVNGVYEVDDVPFSCCDPAAMRPCINTHVHDNIHNFNYDYQKDMTIFKDGCRVKLTEYFVSSVLFVALWSTVALFLLNCIIALLFRFLETSMLTAIDKGNPLAETGGYIFNCNLGGEEYDAAKIQAMSRANSLGLMTSRTASPLLTNSILTLSPALAAQAARTGGVQFREGPQEGNQPVILVQHSAPALPLVQ